MAPRHGFEPRLTESESVFLPLKERGIKMAVQVRVELTSSELTVQCNAIIRPHNKNWGG